MKIKLLLILLGLLMISFLFADYVSIYDIQYTEAASGDSPYDGQVVTTSGIVTGFGYDDEKYFISMPEGGAWKGIYVYDYNNTPDPGDEVEITGTVDEYYNLTELTSITGYSLLSSGNLVPDPVQITTNELASEEMYEGVLVTISNVEVTATPNSYKEWYVDDGSGECQIDDGFYEYLNPLIGDEFIFITGLVDYGFGNYGLNPRSEDDLLAVGDPYFSNIFYSPLYPTTEDDITITATILDYNGTIEYVELFYRINPEENYQIIEMENIGNDQFEVIIDPIPTYDDVYYIEITAEDNDNNTTTSGIIIIEPFHDYPQFFNMQLINDPEPEDTLFVSLNIIDLDGSVIEARLLYTLDYFNVVYESDLIQDSADSTFFTGNIPGQKEGVTVHIGAYAKDDSSLTNIEYNLDSYSFPVRHHSAIITIPAKPFNPYASETFPIEFASQSGDKAILRIYNAEGKLVFEPQNIIISGSTGITHYDWDGRDKNNKLLPLGLYICFLEIIEIDSGHKKTAKAPIVIGAPLD